MCPQARASQALPRHLAASYPGRFELLVGNCRRIVPTLLDSGLVSDGDDCHLQNQAPANISVTIKTLTGKIFSVRVHETWLTLELKEAIQDREGIPPDQQRLLTQGRQPVLQMEDNRSLSSCGIVDGSAFHLVLRLSGGKPVICLWPAQPTDVTVRLLLCDRWAFSSLVPRPDSTDGVQGGRRAEWRVRAQPDGTLAHPASGGRQYGYLFWEALTEGGAVGAEQGGVEGQADVAGHGGRGAGRLGRSGSSASSASALDWEEAAGGPLGCGAGAAATLQLSRGGGPQERLGPLGGAGLPGAVPSALATASAPAHIPGLGPTPADLPLPDFDAGRSFCVAGADAEGWLYGALEAFGVPVRERTDFLTYWLPHMEGAAWLLVAFADPADYQAAADLHVSPAPDMLVRLFMLFERLAAPVAVRGCLAAEVARVGVLRREGAALAVLEWGGMQVVRPGPGEV
ncbi:Ubiquitin-60S ribosomal protein L40 [Tetrabaena socialis]|uniref:Ubiquitin-60S ribosomal protein L40 n=1 Tax=Tetrabaena socialis TaxID=47790 RepID=A0A2J8A949_9CHLO|nr:Ubiquitin-60S ribosomal protein L40 [Tetrabaena socialis]|eukprot:PNH09025.1 Ubiquitin-60S ribosomal protein L40 [Tetrabaena socialis]